MQTKKTTPHMLYNKTSDFFELQKYPSDIKSKHFSKLRYTLLDL